MFNMTEREPEKGWADIKPTPHPQNILFTLSIIAWKLASKMVDDERDWDDIARMQETASSLEDLARSGVECNCILPEQSCKLCRTVTRLIYDEDYIKETK
jgi:hypothetical protein